jgi:hypothetical protein
MKTIADIVPPTPVPGMERPLPDYSERLARRSGLIEAVVEARLSPVRESKTDQ